MAQLFRSVAVAITMLGLVFGSAAFGEGVEQEETESYVAAAFRAARMANSVRSAVATILKEVRVPLEVAKELAPQGIPDEGHQRFVRCLTVTVKRPLRLMGDDLRKHAVAVVVETVGVEHLRNQQIPTEHEVRGFANEVAAEICERLVMIRGS